MNNEEINQTELNENFLTACKNGQLEVLSQLLIQGADIDYLENQGLVLACRNNHRYVVEYLLTSDELLQHSDIYAQDSICLEIIQNYPDLNNFLTEYLDNNSFDQDLNTFQYPIEDVIDNKPNTEEDADWLNEDSEREEERYWHEWQLNSIEKENKNDDISNPKLKELCISGNRPLMIEALKDLENDPINNYLLHISKCKLFVYSCYAGNLELVRYFLLEEHIPIKTKGNIAIFKACEGGQLEVIQYLLTSPELTDHADINKVYGHPFNDGETLYSPFVVSCGNKDQRVIDYLLPLCDITPDMYNEAWHFALRTNSPNSNYLALHCSLKNYIKLDKLEDEYLFACEKGNTKTVEYLFTNEEFNMATGISSTSFPREKGILRACKSRPLAIDTIKYLLEFPGNINISQISYPLFKAAYSNCKPNSALTNLMVGLMSPGSAVNTNINPFAYELDNGGIEFMEYLIVEHNLPLTDTIKNDIEEEPEIMQLFRMRDLNNSLAQGLTKKSISGKLKKV